MPRRVSHEWSRMQVVILRSWYVYVYRSAVKLADCAAGDGGGCARMSVCEARMNILVLLVLTHTHTISTLHSPWCKVYIQRFLVRDVSFLYGGEWIFWTGHNAAAADDEFLSKSGCLVRTKGHEEIWANVFKVVFLLLNYGLNFGRSLISFWSFEPDLCEMSVC